MARPVDALREGVGPDDPWLALLLGCVSWSRALARGVGADATAPLDRTDAASAPRAEPALLALLGMVALDARLRAHLGEIAVPDARAPAPSAGPRPGLLR
ncbi:MAG TPA: hypothetical protein VNF72_15465 [Myxococcota bacterium]|nr:hypothetical protein [Myxococcota bacterium]